MLLVQGQKGTTLLICVYVHVLLFLGSSNNIGFILPYLNINSIFWHEHSNSNTILLMIWRAFLPSISCKENFLLPRAIS